MVATLPSYQVVMDGIIAEVVGPEASAVDAKGEFPRKALDALGEQGVLGLVSAVEVGGSGEGIRAAAWVGERLAGECASTAMVVCMHHCAAAVIEAHGTAEARRAIAEGRALATLAFSEAGSRSHFWAPVSTATRDGAEIRLDAHKSWVTSAGQADYYVWSSKPVEAEGASTLWLVHEDAAGLRIAGAFDGMGLRGNASCPVVGDGVRVRIDAMLGQDGGGFDVMAGIVLPYFQVISAAISVGLMDATVRKTVAHVAGTRFEHLGQSLADLPTIRAYLARMRVRTDMARALLDDTLTAIEGGRPDTMLRVLEVKAAAAEAATEVTELGMRICGGAAFRKEVGVERHFRDAQAATLMAPTTDVLYDLIGKLEAGLPLFG